MPALEHRTNVSQFVTADACDDTDSVVTVGLWDALVTVIAKRDFDPNKGRSARPKGQSLAVNAGDQSRSSHGLAWRTTQ